MAANLNIVSYNCHSVKNQQHELANFLQDHDIDIALLQETFLKPRDTLRIPNYRVFRTDRKTPGGGTAIITKLALKAQEIAIQTQNLENTAIELNTKQGKIKIISAYQAPNKKLVTQDLDAIFALVAGDLNAKHESWSNCKPNPSGNKLRNSETRVSASMGSKET